MASLDVFRDRGSAIAFVLVIVIVAAVEVGRTLVLARPRVLSRVS